MKLNDALPRIEVDAETYDGHAPTARCCARRPAPVLPLAQRYFLF